MDRSDAERLRSPLHVTMIPGDHDYTRALCAHLPRDWVSLRLISEELPPKYMDPRRLLAGTDRLHIHWPAHLFALQHRITSGFLDRYLNFIADVERSDCRAIWTLHNREPHKKAPALFTPVYRAWAQVLYGAIHHSAWVAQLMRSELPFSSRCQHAIIYHGQQEMRCELSRDALEREYGLGPVAMRLGVLGRAQRTKNVPLIARAFSRAARPDQQLFSDAIDEAGVQSLPRDGRIFVLPRQSWLARAEVARRNHLVDALVVAHSGPSCLSSGLVADGLALGLSMLVPYWAFFEEMLGTAGIYHDSTEEGLAGVLHGLTAARLGQARTAMCTLKTRFVWPRLAEQTLAFYRAVASSQVI